MLSPKEFCLGTECLVRWRVACVELAALFPNQVLRSRHERAGVSDVSLADGFVTRLTIFWITFVPKQIVLPTAILAGVIARVASGCVGLEPISVHRQELIWRQRADGFDDSVVVAAVRTNKAPLIHNVGFVGIEGESSRACHHCVGRKVAAPLEHVFRLWTEENGQRHFLTLLLLRGQARAHDFVAVGAANVPGIQRAGLDLALAQNVNPLGRTFLNLAVFL